MDRKHSPRKPPEFIGILLLILFCLQSTSVAQDDIPTNPPPVLTAAKLTGAPPHIDGNLDEDIWEHAPIATGFVQLVPDEGAPASERTEVRVLYGDDALYVAFRALDTDPSAIEGQLTRRDQQSFSEWIHVAIDSYNDKRTAFQFGVNPKGVKQDIYRFDDTKQDQIGMPSGMSEPRPMTTAGQQNSAFPTRSSASRMLRR